MLPSPLSGGHRRTTTTTTTTTTTSSSSHPLSHHLHNPTSPPLGSKTMEEVWKDITLSCLQDSTVPGTPSIRHHRPSSPSFRSIILQDFLNRPSSAASSPASPSPPLPPPPTVLTLNSGPDLFFPTHHNPHGDSTCRRQNNPPQLINGSDADGGSSSGCDLTPFDALASSVLASFGRKRFPEATPVDRRNKRMIKNRESAARSRARKQAYVNELEAEVALLMDENTRLREQQKKQMQETQPAYQLPKKTHALQRTSTAPF